MAVVEALITATGSFAATWLLEIWDGCCRNMLELVLLVLAHKHMSRCVVRTAAYLTNRAVTSYW